MHVECRKGSLGLGRNFALALLDLSETGARLIASTGLDRGQEVEVIFGGCGAATVKRAASVVWSISAEQDRFLIGLHFQTCLRYGDLQRLSSPAPAKH